MLVSDKPRNNSSNTLAWEVVAGQVEKILSEFAVAVAVQDGKGRIVYANPAAARLLDAVPEDRRQRPTARLARRYQVYNQSDQLIPDERLPVRRVLNGEPWVESILHVVAKTGDEEFWLITKAVPVRDDDGKPQFVVSISYDITLLKQAEIQLRNNNSRLMGMLEDVMDTEGFDASLRRRGDHKDS
jgi:PAS domain S-box-containing protein